MQRHCCRWDENEHRQGLHAGWIEYGGLRYDEEDM
jgi:hypothetical protein